MTRGIFDRLPISTAHLAVLVHLPNHHRDPFDHLLIAQAISEDAEFASDDQRTTLPGPRVALLRILRRMCGKS